MLELKTVNQENRIINNIVKACKDIELLNKQGYNFIYLCCGFIAHYDIYGFIYEYKTESLKNEILRYKNENQWNNFTPKEKNYDYYKQKQKIYNVICEKI